MKLPEIVALGLFSTLAEKGIIDPKEFGNYLLDMVAELDMGAETRSARETEIKALCASVMLDAAR